ncbi:MAG TPA: DivIVA domain-containing protein [Cryptosporangiaceae bacterium]|nr:DivIVA domain-containing protein [Cryptosporangiaceae bacterium]
MGDFLLTVVAALVVAAIAFGVAAFVLGRDPGLTPPRPDAPPFDLPDGRPLTEADIRGLRLDTALRGYRMEQVDELLRRVGYDLGELWAHVDRLEAALRQQVGAEPQTRGASAGLHGTAGTPNGAIPDDTAHADAESVVEDHPVDDPLVPAGAQAEEETEWRPRHPPTGDQAS